MKNLLVCTALLVCSMQWMNAQNYDLPPNPEEGKCYERCFDYNKKFEWKEVDCSKVKERNTKFTAAELQEIEEEKTKMMAYQKKLQSLGYGVKVTGIADNETIKAHHKYLKKKKKLR